MWTKTKFVCYFVEDFDDIVLNRLVLFNVLDIETTTPIYCTKPLSTIQCNKTLCQDQLVPILLIG